MNEKNIYSDLIYLVIDGEASDIERTTLFDALHDNPQMQNEFQIALKMNKAAEALPSMYDVPAALTNKLFDKAGLNYSGTTYVQAASTNNLPLPVIINTPGIISKIGAFALGRLGIGLIGLLAGGIMGFYISEFSGDTENLNKPEKFSSVTSAGNFIGNDTDKSKSITENKKNTVKNLRILEPVNENIYKKDDLISLKPALQNEPEKQLENEDNYQDFKILSSGINNNLVRNNNIQISRNNQINNILNTENNYNYNYNESKVLGLEIEVRSSSSWNLPKETVYPSEISKLHNMSLALLYGISDEFMIGLEIRRETFYVKYFSINEFNEKYIYEQQPNLTSYGALLRYKFINNEKLKMFTQNNLSVNYYGIIFRGALGFEYNLFPELSILGMLDYSGLYYQHQNNSNTSDKVSFLYGVNFKF